MVVKFGGSVLEDGAAFRRIAESLKVELERGSRIVVVVSALRGVTDQLLGAAEAISPETPLDVIDHIIGLGEEQSVRLMASAMRAIGIDAVEVTPHSPSWPLVTNEAYGNAEPILKECAVSIELGVGPLLKRGLVPVVCGFVGRSLAGSITTLGRGGGDTTAVVLARCLDADELVLVKDVGGFYTADPKRVADAAHLKALSVWEASLLAASGAKILHGKAFRYKPEALKMRIVSIDGGLGEGGTLISGTVPELQVEVHENPVTSFTLLGDLISEFTVIPRVLKAVEDAGGAVLSVKGDEELTTLYVDGPADDVLNSVHGLIAQTEGVKAVGHAGGLALIHLRGRLLNDVIEATCMINGALSSMGVFPKDVITGHSSLHLLVNWEQRLPASEQIASLFEEGFA